MYSAEAKKAGTKMGTFKKHHPCHPPLPANSAATGLAKADGIMTVAIYQNLLMQNFFSAAAAAAAKATAAAFS